MWKSALRPDDGESLGKARAIAPILEAGAEEGVALRTLPEKTVKAMRESGLLSLGLPKELGGQEADFATLLEVSEELSRADGSAGWNSIANGPSGAFAGAFLGDDAVEEIFGGGTDVCCGGQFAPNGRAEPVDGGYRISGSWNFGSGTAYSEWIMGGFMIIENGAPLMIDGMPDLRVAAMPREAITFTDGWHVMGLQATGSYDYECRDVFVPESYTYPLFSREPRRGGAIFQLGLMATTANGHAAWALGVARRALDEIKALGLVHTRMGAPSTIAQKSTFQRDYIRAEARLHAARLLVIDVFTGVLEAARAGENIGIEERAMLRAAATYATEAAKNAVDLAHEAAGTTSIRNGHVLQRCFRDMHTGTQHAFINEETYLQSSEVFLGLRDDSPML
ncbi:MAG: acyl-CoA dehydrogenase [Deltaproteobacteria bacterium]|jgi:alkylation response protein AidB-like acyl-CoA dehydrogenase|nr:acyl-CoA dehydrogenase [Deltaproteobacteria bacterium]